MKISYIFIMLTCFNFSNAQKATYSVRDLNVVYPISVEIDKINGGYGELKVGGAIENALFEAGFNVVSSLVAYSEAKTSIEYSHVLGLFQFIHQCAEKKQTSKL